MLASARVADLSKILTANIIDPDLIAHQGPVFEVAWAHPKFGNILASCGFDNNIIFWQEQEANQWAPVGSFSGLLCVKDLLSPHQDKLRFCRNRIFSITIGSIVSAKSQIVIHAIE